MLNTALRTNPRSYSKVCGTFWAADCTAARTHLGGEALINPDVFSAVPDGFVAELRPKLRPASIEHGLGQAGRGKSGSIDVSDADERILTHEPPREFVQEMPATMKDLGIQSLYSVLAPATLRAGEPLGVSREVARVAYLLSCGESEQILETEGRLLPLLGAMKSLRSATLSSRFRYQRPRASCAKLPLRISPSTGRLSHRR